MGNSIAGRTRLGPSAVYPRWRGELQVPLLEVIAALGLPPLARGTPDYEGSSRDKQRFTPAGAGNSFRSQGFQLPGAVYPRWRGELGAFLVRPRKENGLPPLARGTLAPVVVQVAMERFTPAGAGNSRKRATCSFVIVGLPPLARGTPFRRGRRGDYGRFTPAGAGNSTVTPT